MNARTMRRIADAQIHFVTLDCGQSIPRSQFTCARHPKGGAPLIYQFLSKDSAAARPPISSGGFQPRVIFIFGHTIIPLAKRDG